jgi:hypothetical protein
MLCFYEPGGCSEIPAEIGRVEIEIENHLTDERQIEQAHMISSDQEL